MENLTWRKSSHSSPNGGDCVEVARAHGTIFARDSKDLDGPRVQFTQAEWHAFLATVKEEDAR
jgi:hypothetical protein